MAMHCKICAGSSRLKFNGLADDRYGYPGEFDVYSCNQCGFAQLYPEVTSDALEQLYTQYYPRKDITAASIKSGVVRHSNWLRGNPSIYLQYAKPAMSVLDIGCGDGASLLTIQSCGAKAVGTEFDHNVIGPAQQLGLNIHIGDITTLPYPDHSFDLITMNQLLEHVADPIAFIQLAKKKLKPNGRLVITTPRLGSVQQRCSGRRWVNWHIPFHVNFFTPASVRYLAKQTGLQIETLRTFTPQGWVVMQWLNLLRPALPVGTANLFWKAKPAGLTKWQYLKQLGPRSAMSLVVAHGVSLFSIPYYRLVDLLGFGDSFQIVLRSV